MSLHLRLTSEPLDLATLRRVLTESVRVEPAGELLAAIDASQRTVGEIVDSGRAAYGINTGFGLLAKTRIPDDQLTLLQRNLVLSHSTGVGEPLDDAVVRLIMVLKVAALARGYSGIGRAPIDAMLRLLEEQIYPLIPAKGSVGASGDLAPLAHLSAALLGYGQMRHRGEVLDAREGLARAGLEPVELGPKDGLALLNGTQVSTALALAGLFAAEDLFAAALVAGAMSVDAAKGSDTPFDPRIHQLRGQPGQIRVAEIFRRLLAGSGIRASHVGCKKVQDPYSLRCQPQVMGACLDMMGFAANTLRIEAAAVTDNPLIMSDTGEVLSGGNFHAEPVAMAADVLAIALAEIGGLSERRIALLIDKHLSDLPDFLVEHGGVNSGFMIAQVTAAALASENKSLAHPASVDSLPTSANQEDHVSMATFAARRLLEMASNTRGIVAVELLAAAQGIDFRRPLESSEILERVHARIRERVPHYDRDRYFAPDIEAIQDLIASGVFVEDVGELLPS